MEDYEELKQQMANLEARLDSMDFKTEAIEKRFQNLQYDVSNLARKFSTHLSTRSGLDDRITNAHRRINDILALSPQIEQALDEAKYAPKPTAWQRVMDGYGYLIFSAVAGGTIATIFILGVLR